MTIDESLNIRALAHLDLAVFVSSDGGPAFAGEGNHVLRYRAFGFNVAFFHPTLDFIRNLRLKLNSSRFKRWTR